AVTQPNPLTAGVATTAISCNGVNDGTITVSNPMGGYGTNEYSIDGGTTWQSSGAYIGLPNTTSDVMIRDAVNTSCLIDLDGSVGTIIIQPSGPLAATLSSTNVTCFGSNDGKISVTSPS